MDVNSGPLLALLLDGGLGLLRASGNLVRRKYALLEILVLSSRALILQRESMMARSCQH